MFGFLLFVAGSSVLLSWIYTGSHVLPKTEYWKTIVGPLLYIMDGDDLLGGALASVACIGTSTMIFYRDTSLTRLGYIAGVGFWFLCGFSYIWQGF